MKKKLLLLTLGLLGVCRAPAQNLQTYNRTMVYEYTADWDSTCGDWVWDVFADVVDAAHNDQSFKAYCVAVHSLSTQSFLNTPLYLDLQGNLNATGGSPPTFIVDNHPFNTNSTPPSLAMITGNVNAATSGSVIAGVGYTATVTNMDSLIVQTKVKFLQSVTGEFRVAVYVAEDSVMANQNNKTGQVLHRMILRDAVQFGTWGSLLTNNGASNGQEYTNQFRMKIPPAWDKDHLEYYAIVYMKGPSTTGYYEVVNVTNTMEPVSTSSMATEDMAFEVYPVPANDKIYIQNVPPGHIKISLTDITGLRTDIIADKYLEKSIHGLEIALPSAISSGTYFIQMMADDIVSNKPITIIR